jgi:hypothetical protein
MKKSELDVNLEEMQEMYNTNIHEKIAEQKKRLE